MVNQESKRTGASSRKGGRGANSEKGAKRTKGTQGRSC